MERLLVVVAVVVVAGVIALVVERRRRFADPPAGGPDRWNVPTQLDRADFVRPEAPWLVAVFTSSTCDSCAGALAKAVVLSSPAVAVEEVEVSARGDLHQRYAVDAVPLIVVADGEGVVQASFVGTPSATDLWAAVAEVREPGASPEPDLGRLHTDPAPPPP